MKVKGIPTRIRSDDGTENCIPEAIQIALRSAQLDEHEGVNSFMVGASPANQRIESFWSHLTKDRPMCWRQFLSELTNMGCLDAGKCINC